MNIRTSDIKDKLKSRFLKNGYKILEAKNTFLKISDAEKTYTIDNIDHTGPVLFKSFKEWIDTFDESEDLILITVGFFHTDISKYLAKSGNTDRIALLQFGLRSIYDDEIETDIFGNTNTNIFRILIEVINEEMRVSFSPEHCDYCERDSAGYCVECGARLCPEHFIPCPLCGAKLCHPDSGKRCYYEHDC